MITNCPKCGGLYETTAEEADRPDRECMTCWRETMSILLSSRSVRVEVDADGKPRALVLGSSLVR